MSYYTVIYPTEGFDLNKDIRDVEKDLTTHEDSLHKEWLNIVSMVGATPISYRMLKSFRDSFETSFFNYVSLHEKYVHESFLYDMLDSIKQRGSDFDVDSKPWLSYNRFLYNYSPETGVRELEKDVKYIKEELLMYVCACPKYIGANKSENENGIASIDTLHTKLKNLKESLDCSLYDLEFSKLCVKFWETHEEG